MPSPSAPSPYALGKAPAPTAQKSAGQAESSVFGRFKLQIAGVVFLERLGLNLAIGGKAFPFPIALFTTPVVVLWNLVTGVAQISMPRIVLYLIFLAALTTSALINNGGDSVMSLFLVAGIYAMFLFPAALDEAAYLKFFRLVANVASIICVIGAVQYVIQYVWSPDWLFSWRTIVPRDFLIEFNTLNEINYGSHIYKANGFFLMEASYQSQLAARALLISIFILKDFRYTIPLGLGLITAYSGTGMVLFGIFGLIPLVIAFARHSRFKMLVPVALLLIPLVIALAWSQLNLNLFLDRMNEFNDPRSSGYARFVNSQLMLQIFGNSDLANLLFGLGPGSTDRIGLSLNAVGEAFGSTWIKVIVDYGLVGFGVFLAFFFTCVRHTLRSNWLAIAFTFHFFYLDGGFAVPQQAFLSLFLGAFVCLRRTGDAQPVTWPTFGRQRAPENAANAAV